MIFHISDCVRRIWYRFVNGAELENIQSLYLVNGLALKITPANIFMYLRKIQTIEFRYKAENVSAKSIYLPYMYVI